MVNQLVAPIVEVSGPFFVAEVYGALKAIDRENPLLMPLFPVRGRGVSCVWHFSAPPFLANTILNLEWVKATNLINRRKAAEELGDLLEHRIGN